MIGLLIFRTLSPQTRRFDYRRLLTSSTAVQRIRNVGIVAHIDAGKTTTTEHILYVTGKIDSIGRVDRGDTVMDFLPQEKERGITISSAAISCNWKGQTINIIDTPGHVDFSIEVELATRVLDGCVILLDAVAGVQCQTKSVWRRLTRRGLPAVAFVNKMDRVGASFDMAILSISRQLHVPAIALQAPIFMSDSTSDDERFVGIVDLLTRTRFIWPDGSSSTSPIEPIASVVSESDSEFSMIESKREALLETIAGCDDEFLDRYLSQSDANPITTEEIASALRRITLSRRLLPVFCGATLKGIGTHALLDGIVSLLPSPADVSLPGMATISGDLNNTTKIGSRPFSRDLEIAAMVFKLNHQAGRGLVAFARIFAGELQAGDSLRNLRTGKDERLNSLLAVEAEAFVKSERVAGAGEVVCLAGMRNVAPGDLLVSRSDAAYLSKRSELMSDWLQRASVEIPPPVFALALETESASQVAALDKALTVLMAEDPSLTIFRDSESGQLILRGLGELHLEIAVDKLKRQHRVAVTTGQTYIAYRETLQLGRDLRPENLLELIRNSDALRLSPNREVKNIESTGKSLFHDASYERQLEGGKRLFAAFSLEVTPLSEIQLSSPAEYIIADSVLNELNAVERDTIMDTMRRCFERGPQGYPVTGIRVSINAISRDISTTPGAIRACLSSAMAKLLSPSSSSSEDVDVPILLEPVMKLEITVPNDYLGTVMSDLTSHRMALHVQLRLESETNELEVSSKDTLLDAIVPLRSILGYASALRSMTKGEGSFSAEYLLHLYLQQ